MSGNAPGEDQERQVDALYQRLSQRAAGGPSQATRRAILRGARDIARARRQPSWTTWLRRLRDSCGHPAVFGTLAAGIVAALLLVPLRQPPVQSPEAARTAAVPVQIESRPRKSADSPAAPAPAPASAALPEAVRGAGPTPRDSAAGAPSALPKPDTPIEEVVVRKSTAQDAARPMPPPPPADGNVAVAAARSAGAPPAGAAAAISAGVQLRRAAASGDSALLADLIRTHMPPLDERDAQGRTALMLAVMARAPESVRLLLEAGADPNLPDAQGTRPLQLAAGDPQILRLLSEHGAR